MSSTIDLTPDQPYETTIGIDIDGVLKEYTLTVASKMELMSLMEQLNYMTQQIGSNYLTTSEFQFFIEQLFHSDAYELVSALTERDMQIEFLSSIVQIMYGLCKQDHDEDAVDAVADLNLDLEI